MTDTTPVYIIVWHRKHDLTTQLIGVYTNKHIALHVYDSLHRMQQDDLLQFELLEGRLFDKKNM